MIGFVIKKWSAVFPSVDDFEVCIQVVEFVLVVEFMGLVYGDLGVLISMKHEQGWVMGVNVFRWAGFLGQGRVLFGLAAQKELQGWNPNAEAVRSGLMEDGEEVGGAVVVNNGLNV